MTMKAVDLFAGAGGLGLGLERSGISVVLANEIEKDFAKTYQANHPDAEVVCAPIQQIDNIILEPGMADIVAGGPPCQGFSTVGSKKQDDPRNNLFLEFLRVVERVQPRYVLFENVSGFKRLYNGTAHTALTKQLSGLGYSADTQILDAANYGVPQFRQRTIVFAWKRGVNPVAFPVATHGNGKTALQPWLNLEDAISDLPELQPDESIEEYASEPLNQYQLEMRQGRNSLSEHNCASYGEKMRKILSLLPKGGSIEDIPNELRPKSYFKNTYARLLPDSPSPTITRNFGTPSSSRCVHPFENRALSTREGARLQSFPDSYAFHGSKGSKNLQIGNAVPPLLAKALGDSIVKAAGGLMAA